MRRRRVGGLSACRIGRLLLRIGWGRRRLCVAGLIVAGIWLLLRIGRRVWGWLRLGVARLIIGEIRLALRRIGVSIAGGRLRWLGVDRLIIDWIRRRPLRIGRRIGRRRLSPLNIGGLSVSSLTVGGIGRWRRAVAWGVLWCVI